MSIQQYDVAKPYGVIDIHDITKLAKTDPEKAKAAAEAYYGMQYQTRQEYLTEAYEKGGIHALTRAAISLPPETTPETVLVLPPQYSPEQWRDVGQWATAKAFIGKPYEPEEKYRIPQIPRGAIIEAITGEEITYRLPERVSAPRYAYYDPLKGIVATQPIPKKQVLPIKESEPWTSEWIIKILEKMTEKPTLEERIAHEVFFKRKGFEAPPKLGGPERALREIPYIPVGAYQVVESFWRPTTPTLVGAGVSYVFTGGKTEVFGPEVEKVGRHPGLLLGELIGEYYTGKAVAWGLGKAWKGVKYVTPQKVKEPISYAVKFGRPAKLAYKTKMKILYWKPIYKLRQAPTYIKERFRPPKGIAIEKSLIWGEEKFLLPGEFEVWATVKEPTKYWGYPILYGKKATYEVIQVTKPTAFQQIQKAIERGMYPKMGTLTAHQILVTKKPIPKTFIHRIAYERTVVAGTPKVTKRMIPLLFPRLLTPPKVKAPTKLLPKPKIVESPFEMEKLKFRPLELIRPEAKEREKIAPKLAQTSVSALKQSQKQMQQQRQRLRFEYGRPPQMQKPSPRFVLPRLRFKIPKPKRKEKGLFGRWFERVHPIPTPAQMRRPFFGKRKRRKKRGRRRLSYIL